MKINRNMSAVITNKQLLRTENKLSKSMERLSSGYKINRAGDNPAGMAISNKMKAQIDALDQAESNASDGESVLRIADGALNEVSSILQRIRELSVQAANGTNSYSDRKSMQDEIDKLTEEVDRISSDTEYNTKTLLDGSSDVRVYSKQTERMDISDHVLPGTYEFTVDTPAESAEYKFRMPRGTAGGSIQINGINVEYIQGMTEDAFYEQLRTGAEKAGCVASRTDDGGFSIASKEYGSKQELTMTFSKALAEDLGVDADPNAKKVENSEDFSISKKGTDAKITLTTSDDGFSKTDIGAMSIQIGANQYQDMDVRIPEVSSESLYLDKVDVTVVGGPEDAMNRLDEAIAKLNDVRSRIGAFTNRLEYASNSLAETHEDMTNAYSGILDTDMAEEMTEYTQQNVLEQATVSVLAQANDLPEKVLSLLQ